MIFRSIAIILVIALVAAVTPITGAAATALNPPPPPAVQSAAAILIEQRTGQVIWEHNADQRRAIASTTKVMTALLVLEQLGINQRVAMTPASAGVGGSRLDLKPGDERTAEELLYALMLLSANNVAATFAERIGGNESRFTQMMNERAAKAGAVNTVFANPHGLPAPGAQFSTAKDMALITAQAMKHPIFRRIVSSRDHDFTLTAGVKRLENSNALLSAYPYAAGVKTGYTADAGYCLVAAARRGGMSLIAVILGSNNRAHSFGDARALFEHGFNNYAYRQLVTKDKAYAKVKLADEAGTKLKLVASRDILSLVYDLPASIDYKPRITAVAKPPIRKGERMGDLIVTQFGKEIGQTELIAAADVEPEAVPVRIKKNKGWLRSILAIFGL